MRARAVAVALSILGGCFSSSGASVTVEASEPQRIEAALVVAELPAERVGATPTRSAVALPAAMLGFPVPSATWTPAKPPVPAPCPSTVDGIGITDRTVASDPRLQGRAVVVVAKERRRLWLFESGQLAGCWSVGLGFDPRGDKAREGDGRTPEGWYRTSDKPWSSFDGAIAVHYPNAQDAERGREAGTISRATQRRISEALRSGKVPPQRTAMGGAVLIHGGGSASDWTLGCVALDDEDLAQLREQMPAGQRANLLILP
jgi:hypothetical protein